MKRIIIDCDPGLDDAIALILAHKKANVVGITTVDGNTDLTNTTANALLVTALLRVDTPVHAGSSRPLAGPPRHASNVHGNSGLGDVFRISHDKKVTSNEGVRFLLESAAPDVWVVALGPLTNIALAIERDPLWVKRIAGISLMGGSTDAGNVTPVSEFNVYVDPEAAERVFRSGANIIMCGLNLTRQIIATDLLVEELAKTRTRVARFSAEIFKNLLQRIAKLNGVREAALHDPCAVLAVTHPELITTELRTVNIELDGTLTRGMTIVDKRPVHRANATTVNVGYKIDSARALQIITESLE